MARVCFVVPRFHMNLFFATRALVTAGHAVSILTMAQSRLEDYRHVAPVKLGRDASWRAVHAALQAADPDVIFIRTTPGVSAKALWLARLLPRAHRLTYSLQPLHDPAATGRRLSHRLKGLPERRVTPVLGDPAQAAADPRAFYLPWPTGVLDGFEIAPRDQRSDPLRVLCVGKHSSPRKNHDLVIDALDKLGGDRVARLTIAGSTRRLPKDGAEAHADQLHRRAEDFPWIEILGDLTFAEMAARYAAHHVCVLPSHDEPLGIAPVEGMAYGTIPIISRQSGSSGYIRHGENGLVVDADDPETVRAALEQVTRNHDLRQRLSEGARATAAGELGEAQFLERFEALLAAL